MRKTVCIAAMGVLASVGAARGQPEPPPGPASPAGALQDCDRCWVDAEYLLWFTKNSHVPPLFTTGSPKDSPPAALGQPDTSVLFGGDVDHGVRPGGRF